MVWEFQKSLAGKFSNPYDEVEFQAKIYKKIDLKTAKAIIAATHNPNRFMKKISFPYTF